MDSCGRAQEGTRVWFGSQVPLFTVPGREPLRQTGRFCYWVQAPSTKAIPGPQLY